MFCMCMEEVYGYGYRISLNKGNNYAQTSQVGVPLNGSRHNGGWGMITTTHHRVIERVQSKRRLHHADSGASCGRSRYHGSSSLARSGGCELTSGRKAGERWRREAKTGLLTPSCLLQDCSRSSVSAITFNRFRVQYENHPLAVVIAALTCVSGSIPANCVLPVYLDLWG